MYSMDTLTSGSTPLRCPAFAGARFARTRREDRTKARIRAKREWPRFLHLIQRCQGLILLAGCLAALSGCSEDITEIVLVTSTDLAVPSEATAIHIAVQGESGNARESLIQLAGLSAVEQPISLSVVPGGDQGDTLNIRVQLRKDETVVLEQRLQTNFVEGARKLLSIPLTHNCASVCCDSDQTCSGGTCIDSKREGRRLPNWEGELPPSAVSLKCSPNSPEICNGLDDNCDGNIDEDTDLRNDVLNCGACGRRCRAGSQCIEGVCSDQRIIAVAAGAQHSCVARENASALCWGSNTVGQLGDGSTLDSPIPLDTKLDLRQVISAQDFSCGISTSDTMLCWGDNRSGQLGIGDSQNSNLPIPVLFNGFRRVQAMALGAQHACALLDTGDIECWGSNLQGQLGIPAIQTIAFEPQPVTLPNNAKAISIAAGAEHSCALTFQRQVYCWGNNSAGQLGLSTAQASLRQPTQIDSAIALNGQSLTAGQQHTCMHTQSGHVWCWGSNQQGQLGNRNASNNGQFTPLQVEQVDQVVQLSQGSGINNHTCALLNNRTLRCWGSNPQGQLGNGSQSNASATATLVRTRSDSSGMPSTGLSPLLDVEGAAAGASHGCAIANRRVLCWGSNATGQVSRGAPAIVDAALQVQCL